MRPSTAMSAPQHSYGKRLGAVVPDRLERRGGDERLNR